MVRFTADLGEMFVKVGEKTCIYHFNRGLHGFHRFLDTKAQRHKEIVNRGLHGLHRFLATENTEGTEYLIMFNHGFTQINTDFVLASFGVFCRAFPRSELLRNTQPQPPVHFSMPHL